MKLKFSLSQPNFRKPLFILSALAISFGLFLILPFINLSTKQAINSEIIKPKDTQKTYAMQIKPLTLQKRTKKIKLKNLQTDGKNNSKSSSQLKLNMNLSLAGNGVVAFQGKNSNILQANEADVAPIKKFGFFPTYPLQAEKEQIETNVIAEIIISASGKVEQVKIIDSLKNWGFEEATKQALQHWIFEPATINQIPIRVIAKITIQFRL